MVMDHGQILNPTHPAGHHAAPATPDEAEARLRPAPARCEEVAVGTEVPKKATGPGLSANDVGWAPSHAEGRPL